MSDHLRLCRCGTALVDGQNICDACFKAQLAKKVFYHRKARAGAATHPDSKAPLWKDRDERILPEEFDDVLGVLS